MPFPGLFHDGPKSGAAAEIAAHLSLPQAAVDRNSQDARRSETGITIEAFAIALL